MNYLISIGSNCQSAAAMMARAEEWLRANFSNVHTSGIYSTQAVNGTSPDYLNMVAQGESSYDAEAIVAAAKAFEAVCGRTPQSKLRGCIEMDVDIIAAGNETLRPGEYSRPYFIKGLRNLEQRLSDGVIG